MTRFIAKSSQHTLPFFRIMRKGTEFKWDEKCEATFQKVKETLSSPLMLVKLEMGKTLYLYLAMENEVISVALDLETDEH